MLCSGPKSNEHNIQHSLRKLDFYVDAHDILDGSDITDGAVWEDIMAKIHADYYDVIICSPPCGAFSRLRGIPGGPSVLPGLTGRARYSLPNLTVHQKEIVREANLIDTRCLKAFTVMAQRDHIAILEQPGLREGEVSMMRLDEALTARNIPGVEHVIAHSARSVLARKSSPLGSVFAYPFRIWPLHVRIPSATGFARVMPSLSLLNTHRLAALTGFTLIASMLFKIQ